MTPSQTKLLEDLRSGAVRLVPVEATDAMYDAAHELVERKNGTWGWDKQVKSPGDMWRAMLSVAPDVSLAEMIEGLVRERDKARAGRAEAERENKRLDRELTAALAGQVANVVRREEANAYGDAEHARALAAEARIKALERVVDQLERQNRVNDRYAEDFGPPGHATRELWLICNSHVKDRTRELREAIKEASDDRCGDIDA